MAYSHSTLIGGNFDETTSDKKWAVGQEVPVNNGTAVYVSAGSTISQFNAVIIDSNGGAVPVTTTNAATSKRVGFAQVSIASGYFGWVHTSGMGLRVSLAANCAPNVPLYTTATAGVLDDAVVSEGLILGIVATTSISNATAVTCLVARGAMVGSGDMA